MRRVTRRQLLGHVAAAAAGSAAMPALSAGAQGRRSGVGQPFPPVPTRQQLAWQEAELTMFMHFGMNTFTNREWGEGTEDPRTFNPSALDAVQWVSAARQSGFRYIILTAKHHDGFCLWPSQYTEHSVKNSPWQGGKGDVVRAVADACAQARVRFGFYLSPWDRHERSYGDSPVYNTHFRNQLAELLTGYGDIAEVWFDGANGEGPNGKKQEYDWDGYFGVVRKLQPKALIAICGPDVRWVGNEDGFAHETEWSVQPASPSIHKASTGQVWWPAECDVSIRPGWFWHKAEDEKIKTLPQLMDIYYRSVGHNANLLLNVPPNDRGLISRPDVARLAEFRAFLDRLFATDLARGRPTKASSEAQGAPAACATDGWSNTYWAPEGSGAGEWLEVDFGKPVRLSTVCTEETIALGQRVEGYRIEGLVNGAWQVLARGTTIGHKKIDRFAPVAPTNVRLVIERCKARPLVRALSVYAGESA